ncbi:Hypothetical predicted protein [Mytilus galloprovincialis]|uniref:Fibrinogen C-terminal domain-containing protein n=1 Tax=Mytilus galloprovincialis TaxID=29158 RepID=A0A8B6D3S8_MYTGA|nr:Hypothetical predicted protein [Mytilus galloprovincialis]
MVFILCFIFTILCTVECQDYIFKTIDSLEERLSALESNRNACPACCDCADIKTKYNDLKVEMGQVMTTVNQLKLELKRLQPSESTSKQISTTSGSQNGMDQQTSKLNVALSTVEHNSIPSITMFNTKPIVSNPPVTFLGTAMETILPTTSAIASTSTQNLTTTAKTTSPTTSSKTISTTAKTTLPTTSSTISAKTFTTPAGPQHDCKDVIRNGHKGSGLYDLSLPNGKQITAYCDQQNDEGRWIVIQRRVDGKQSFNQNWNQYKAGFGNPLNEFWIGNENLHALTDGKDMILHIKMMTWEEKNYTAVYSGFRVGSEQEKYKLNIQQMISGDAGDSFKYPSSYMLRHNNMAFSTPDRDNDVSFQNCAKVLQSGWWFNQCYSSNLNGVYLGGPYGHRNYGESFGQPTTEGTGIEWYPLKQKQYSMKYVEMKIRAK